MILITLIMDDGKEGMTYPLDDDDVNKGTEQFLEFCKDHPMVVLGAKTAKIRRVVEMEDITEITIPEADLVDLLKDAHEMLQSRKS